MFYFQLVDSNTGLPRHPSELLIMYITNKNQGRVKRISNNCLFIVFAVSERLEMEKLRQSYQDILEKILEFMKETDVDKVATRFLKQEEENFALFNYVNEVNNEVSIWNSTGFPSVVISSLSHIF